MDFIKWRVCFSSRNYVWGESEKIVLKYFCSGPDRQEILRTRHRHLLYAANIFVGLHSSERNIIVSEWVGKV